MNILLTGYSGNLGLEIARSLGGHSVFAMVRNLASAPRQAGVTLIESSLESLPRAACGEIEAIVHGAASTAFRAPLEELRRVNVDGTSRLLEFARGCPRLQRFIHLSTTCVCGDSEGLIPEAPLPSPGRFINPYEQSKWEAEAAVLEADLPVEIIRLSIVAGSAQDGAVRRIGALHQALFWLYKGLIPMVPALPSSRLDLISTEFAAAVVAAVLHETPCPGRIVHAAAGEAAPTIAALFAHLSHLFALRQRGWQSGAIATPDFVDAQTFALFEASVRQSGDLLFQRVCADAQAFLPGLLHPRILATGFSKNILLADWRTLTGKVFAWLEATAWGRQSTSSSSAHAAA